MNSREVLYLLIITFGAYIMPMLSRRLMLPSSVGEIFFGMLVGALLGPLTDGIADSSIKSLSYLGFLLLMYIAGLELDFDRLSALTKREAMAYTLFCLLLVIGSFVASAALNLPVFFSVVIMTSAVGLLFTVLKELNLVKTTLGQTIILLGAICEVITLVGFVVVTLMAREADTVSTLISIANIAGFVAVTFIVIKFMRLYLWWHPETMAIFMSTGTPSEIGVRANLFNLFLFVGLSHLVGIEDILGALLGGLIFAKLFAERGYMLEKLSGFGHGFLIPIFFIEVGTRFSFRDFLVPNVLFGAITLVFVIFAVRFVATAVFFITKKFKLRELVLIPFSLSFPLTLLLAAASLGLSNNLISRDEASIIVLAAIISAILLPWLMKLIAQKTDPIK